MTNKNQIKVIQHNNSAFSFLGTPCGIDLISPVWSAHALRQQGAEALVFVKVWGPNDTLTVVLCFPPGMMWCLFKYSIFFSFAIFPIMYSKTRNNVYSVQNAAKPLFHNSNCYFFYLYELIKSWSCTIAVFVFTLPI